MDAGFKAMNQESGTLADQLVSAFKAPFFSSTYHRHASVWTDADSAVMARAVQCGRKPGGEWNILFKKYHKA
jgi:hypothetical protein